MTWKHVLIVVVGCATAAFGAWVTILAPNAAGGPMVITLGATVAAGALAHAGQGLTLARTSSSSSAPSGGVPSSYIPSAGSIPHEIR